MSTAPDLSAAEAAKVAEFEAAPTPPEVLRERLRLDFEAELQKVLMQRVASEFAGRLADAALAVFRGQQDPAVQRVLALADELSTNEPGLSWLVLRRRGRLDAWVKARDVAARLTAALSVTP